MNSLFACKKEFGQEKDGNFEELENVIRIGLISRTEVWKVLYKTSFLVFITIPVMLIVE